MDTRKLWWMAALAALSATAIISTTGCSKVDDGMNQDQQKKTDRLDEIAKKADGDWAKVSQADRDYILKNITSGSEQAAKMVLLGKAGKIKGAPGGASTK